jgi:hypothetical protein
LIEENQDGKAGMPPRLVRFVGRASAALTRGDPQRSDERNGGAAAALGSVVGKQASISNLINLISRGVISSWPARVARIPEKEG